LADARQSALDAVATDRWEPSIGATPRPAGGGTKIVFDRFHVMRDMTKAVDVVRRQEHRVASRRRGFAAHRHHVGVALHR
jgi:transposase